MLPGIITLFCAFCLINIQLTDASICSKYLDELSNSQSLFLQCVTKHSVPVTMCHACKNQYDDVLLKYDKLTSECNTTYFDKDRLNLVPATEALLTGIWTKGYCDDCFNNNNSDTFHDLNTTFYGCIFKNPDKPCDKCKGKYNDLNTFYISLDQHNNGEVCFDLQDSMNRTRYLWSKELKCCLREYNTLYFSIALGITTCLTFMFYCSTYLLTKRQERNHGILNDEDPVFNSTSPSSSSAIAHLNIRNNSGSSNLATANELNTNASTSEKFEKNKISKAVEPDSDSSVESHSDSSDEELLIKNSPVKEKLK